MPTPALGLNFLLCYFHHIDTGARSALPTPFSFCFTAEPDAHRGVYRPEGIYNPPADEVYASLSNYTTNLLTVYGGHLEVPFENTCAREGFK